MNKELSDRAWRVLPAEFKEEVKKEYRVACQAWGAESLKIRLEMLFGLHNLTSDAEGEEEMLYVSRKRVQEEYAIISKELSHRDTDAEDYIAWNYAKMTFEELFGSKCLPDEKPNPAEPKFKVGDRVRVLTHHGEDTPLKGEVFEIIDMDKSDPIATYYLDIDLELLSYNWYSESDLEPCTEPTDNPIPPDSGELKSQELDNQFDTIHKDGFSKERRLNIATQMVSAYIHCEGMTDPSYIATIAFQLADALIAECEKGGEDA